MNFNVREYSKKLEDSNIYVIYSGPIWANGIDGIAEMMLKRLELDDIPLNLSQRVFSVFVEQINNMMMYSAEKDGKSDKEGNTLEISKGIFILGINEDVYFVKTGNLVTRKNALLLAERIDYLNNLDKTELRKFYKQQLQSDNENSSGAGVGLIEIARRASGKIEYELEPLSCELSCEETNCGKCQYFTMQITIK